MLHVKSEQLGETVVLRCAGRLVRGHETGLLCAAVSRNKQNLILDLSKVDAIDAAGIGGLVSLQAAGIYLQLMDPTKAVREVFASHWAGIGFRDRQLSADRKGKAKTK